ncbi:MAG TPA: Gfo/Idh/MocA family oxidoreductase [Chthoniobacterales bacterium]|jgi:predicted dehydrogenase
MSTQKFRIGIIGAGGIAQAVHIPGWKKLPDVEIVAVCDLHGPTAQKAAAAAGGAQAFTDPAELLALGLDAVDVCTPNKAHTPSVILALEAGCHVLCEKPLATSTDEIRAMGAAATKAGRVLCTVQDHRYRAETQAIKTWANAGHLGAVYHARVRAMRRAWLPGRAGFIDAELAGGGPCMDIGVHALDAAMWVMDFPKPVRVTGVSRVNFAHGHKIPGKWGDWDRSRFSVEDFAAGFVHFENGATMILEAAWLGHQKEDEDFSFQLFGTEGGVHWPSGEIASVSSGVFVDGQLSSPGGGEQRHDGQIAAFYRACVAGEPSPVPWTESIQVIAILEAIYASQRTGREIEFTQPVATASPDVS